MTEKGTEGIFFNPSVPFLGPVLTRLAASIRLR